MKKVCFIVSLWLSTPLFAQPQGVPESPPSPAMVTDLKQIKIDGIQGRLSILQSALSCMNNAIRFEQIQGCEEAERQAMTALSQQQKAKVDALRSKRFGVPDGPPPAGALPSPPVKSGPVPISSAPHSP